MYSRADHAEAGGRKPAGNSSLGAFLVCAALATLQGCAALSNPVANGIPVRRLSPELLAEPKEGMQTIPLTLLRQPPPKAYVLAPRDVLGIWVEGVLGEKGTPPLARVESAAPGERRQPAAVGFPIPVREDGTITLPLVPPIRVSGMTLEQAEDAIRKAYTVDKAILKAGRDSIIVTLQRPREYHILVIRQDSATETAPAGGGITGARTAGFVLGFGAGARGTRKGTGFSIDLPAYENDLLNALARTGGFPGSDAVNEVVIERGSFEGLQGRQSLTEHLLACPPGTDPIAANFPGTQRIRIPLRFRPGQPPTIRPEDVILQTGDVVFIEAREADVFYAGGLLPIGEYTLPRDTDLNVLQALTRIGGPIWVTGINTVNISGQMVNPGFGLPNPTLLSVIRQKPDGGQVVIRVSIERALRDPDGKRILIQAKDFLLLQEAPQEALARYAADVFTLNFVYTFVNNAHALFTSGATYPPLAP